MLLACAGLWESPAGRLLLKLPLVWDCNFKARTSQLVLNVQFCYRFQKDRLPVPEIAPGCFVAGLEQSAGMRTPLLPQLLRCFVVSTVQVREKGRAVGSRLRSTVSRGAADL